LASTAASHPVAVRRSRKRSCASTEVGTELRSRVESREAPSAAATGSSVTNDALSQAEPP
jgi:hypothetical protein